MTRLLVGIAITLGFASLAHADKVDDLVRAELKKQQLPGVSIAVVRNGKVVKAAGYGFANLEHQVPARAETVYQSGSVGKMFTAALVLLLEQDGKFNLDDSIRKHLPEAPESWSGITIRHLLNHTSGLGDPFEKLDLRKDYTDAELLKLEGEVPLLFKPGEKWAYSNMGYHVLGFLCNRVGGKFYADQLRERIFAPLKMSTRIISEADIIPNRAAGYELENDKLQNHTWVAPELNTTADGSLYLTVLDLARWDAGLYADTPLNKALKDQLWTPGTLTSGKKTSYGFGWQIDEVNGHKRLHHSGAWQGFTSQLTRYVDDRLTVAVLINRAGANPGRIAEKIARAYLPDLAPKPIPDTEPQKTAEIREILLKLAAGTLEKETFDNRQQAVLFPERIKDFPTFLKTKGTLRSMALLARRDEEGKHIYEYLATYTPDVFRLTLTLDSQSRITEIAIRSE